MSPVRLAIVGCCGRMGKTLIRLAAEDPTLQVVAAVTVASDPSLGKDAGLVASMAALGVPITERCEVPCDAVVEFTLPAGCRAWAGWCAENGVPLVSGTTGLSDADLAALRTAAQSVPVVWSPNMSVGINLLLQLAAEAARRLDRTWDVEICETHHKEKIDAPSGTARALFEAVCAAHGQDPLDSATYGRYGQCGPRQPGEIGIHALRLGSNIGEHEVHFASTGETLTLRHRAHSRDIFAAGALHAARWVIGREPGLYHMRDVLAS
jgi:4-hydroxy-tetrahydrodipicolinate reductase